MITDSAKITQAFKELRKKGWFARKAFMCCQSCGCAAIPDDYNNKFVFYHKQDAEALIEDRYISRGDLRPNGMYMSHGEGGDGMEIVNALVSAGLNVEWDETNYTRILVKHNESEGRGTYTKIEAKVNAT